MDTKHLDINFIKEKSKESSKNKAYLNDAEDSVYNYESNNYEKTKQLQDDDDGKNEPSFENLYEENETENNKFGKFILFFQNQIQKFFRMVRILYYFVILLYLITLI